MSPPPGGAPTPVILAFSWRQCVRPHVRSHLVLLAVAEFAVEPKRRMRPEGPEGDGDQHQHELRCEPGIGVLAVIIIRGMRLEGGESGCRVPMAIPAGAQEVCRR